MDGSPSSSSLSSSACVFVYLEANKRAKGSPTAEMLASVSSVSLSIDREVRTGGVNIIQRDRPIVALFFCTYIYSGTFHILSIESRVGEKLQGSRCHYLLAEKLLVESNFRADERLSFVTPKLPKGR